MVTLTFTSHYFKIELNVKVTNETAERLFSNKFYHPMELYYNDRDGISQGYEPKYFSRSQIRKLDTFFSKDNMECWGDVIITKRGKLSTDEVLHDINNSGGFNNWHHLSKKDVAEWVLNNFNCSKKVAKKVAFYIA